MKYYVTLLKYQRKCLIFLINNKNKMFVLNVFFFFFWILSANLKSDNRRKRNKQCLNVREGEAKRLKTHLLFLSPQEKKALWIRRSVHVTICRRGARLRQFLEELQRLEW